MDKWTPRVITSLNERFGKAGCKRLCALLKETGALIAGGFVLSACVDKSTIPKSFEKKDKKQDTDIYVPVKFIPRFLDAMFVTDPIFKPTHYHSYSSSLYCESFLKKNGIRRIYNFANMIEYQVDIEIDVMAVRNKRGVLSVVNNFDLTFCQVWFNGTDVYASHPEHIKEKKGLLQTEYCKTLLTGNRFLKNRIQKYTARGYTIALHPDFVTTVDFSDILKLVGSPNRKSICTFSNPRLANPEYQERWFNRIAMRWFLNIRDSEAIDIQDEDRFLLAIPLKLQVLNDQTIRLDRDKDLGKSGAVLTKSDFGTGITSRGPMPMEKNEDEGILGFIVNRDDGYDSEDMDEDSIKAMAITNFHTTGELVEPVSDELKYLRGLSSLYINSRTRSKTWGRNKTALINIEDNFRGKENPATPYLELISKKCLKTGDDFLGDTGELFHIHKHPLDGAITRESLEGYLESTMAGNDSYEVKCFWTPEAEVRGQPRPKANCQEMLTLPLIRAIVSREFYQRYSAPRPNKEGLDQNVGLYESVFTDVKTTDPAYGDIYHVTMCPFCLKSEERNEGCAYMTHENPKKLSFRYSPFCKVERTTGLFDKYKQIAADLGEVYVHLEFCVECGRPCLNHKHFNLEGTDLIENRQIPDPDRPGQLMTDFGNCAGGGRQEMIARMLAVRDVYRIKNYRDVDEERRIAADMADKAPLDAGLMARAAAILAKEIPAFNKPVGVTKRYNNPLYDEDTNDANDAMWNSVGKNAKPASPEQRQWNKENIDYIYFLVAEALEGAPDVIVNPILEATNRAQTTNVELNTDENSQIDLGLVRSLIAIVKTSPTDEINKVIKKKLEDAYRLGGLIVTDTAEEEGYVIAEPATGGKRSDSKRNTYKRRKGLLKRTKQSKKNRK